jgi:hypothetical protein
MAWHMALCRMRLLCFQGVLPARPCRRMQAGPPGGLPRQGQTFRQIFLVKICRVFRIMCKRPTLLCSVSDKTTNFEKFEKSRRKGPVLCYNKYDTNIPLPQKHGPGCHFACVSFFSARKCAGRASKNMHGKVQ